MSDQKNQFNEPVQCVSNRSWEIPERIRLNFCSCSFDLCEDTGASNAFFPSGTQERTRPVDISILTNISGHGALTGSFTEVSCSEWSGSEGSAEWTGACLSGQTASLWPSGVGCGNKGEATRLKNHWNKMNKPVIQVLRHRNWERQHFRGRDVYSKSLGIGLVNQSQPADKFMQQAYY